MCLFVCDRAQNTAGLPGHKPRYLMGVGYPLDIVVCVALGVDMFDCVYPTRTARFGVALTPQGMCHLRDIRSLFDTVCEYSMYCAHLCTNEGADTIVFIGYACHPSLRYQYELIVNGCSWLSKVHCV